MVKVVYIEPTGEAKEVNLEPGYSLMEGAVMNGVSGIAAECGGSCSCATCHGYIEPTFMEQVGPADGDEDDMLEYVEERTEYSRLLCQVKVTEKMEGMTITIPEEGMI